MESSSSVWESFQQSFEQVQALLDENRRLIREINQNHSESKIDPQRSLNRNVALIRQLNSNIARVVQLYAHLSTDFVKSMTQNSAGKEEMQVMENMDDDASLHKELN